MSTNSFFTDPEEVVDPIKEVQAMRIRLEEAHKDKKELEIEFLNLKRNYIKVNQELQLARNDPQSGAMPEAMRQRFETLEMQHEELIKSKDKRFDELYQQLVAKEASLTKEV